MTIRKKTLLIIGLTLFCLAFSLSVSARLVLLPSFAELERKEMLTNVERVVSSIETKWPERTGRDLLRIQSAGRHLLSLISDILDLSKIEAGKMALTVDNFEVSRLVTEVANSTQALAITRGNHLEIH